MIKVKYIYPSSYFDYLTNGVLYKVIGYRKNINKYQDTIILINDIGEEEEFIFRIPKSDLFEDATAEYRDSVINEILK